MEIEVLSVSILWRVWEDWCVGEGLGIEFGKIDRIDV